MPKIDNMVEMESGPRILQTGNYKGVQIEVVTGYFIVEDNYPVHVYATKPGGTKEKIDRGTAPSKQTALEWGFQRAAAWIDTGK